MGARGLGRPSGHFTQHRRVDRLRELLTTRPKGLSLRELADALGVTERSVRRYLKEIEREYELEPITDKAGLARRWRLRAGEIPRKVELRRTQAYAILAARRLFEPMKGSALYDEISLAIEKLQAVAQRPGRGPNAGFADARLEQRFLYLPFTPKNYDQKTDELDDVFQAVSDLRPLSCLYRRGQHDAKEEPVTIHPYAMVLYRDSIYCVGRHVQKDEVRTFLLDRMRDTVAAPTERFELPSDFDVNDYFQGEFGIWKSETRRKVVIDFDAHAAEYVRMRRVHTTQRLAGIAGGGIRLTMTIGDLKEVTSWVLGWGRRARVVEPPELVSEVEEELRAALAAYGAPTKVKRQK